MSNDKDELRLSVSKTKTFIDCKAKFNYAYNLKMPKKEWDFHIFGKFCHKVLEDFHLEYLNGSKAAYNVVMSKAFKAALVEYKASMTPEMKKECWDLVDKYLRIVSDDKKNNLSANVLACEKNFGLPIGNEVLLNGMIDRIQLDADNVIHVADYKTTKNKKYLKEDWFQLLTYAYYIITVERPDVDMVRGSYILLRHDFEYITKEFTRDEILSVADKYIEYAKQIRNEKIFEPNPTFLCNYCDFLEHCQEGKQKVSPQNVFGEVKW